MGGSVICKWVSVYFKFHLEVALSVILLCGVLCMLILLSGVFLSSCARTDLLVMRNHWVWRRACSQQCSELIFLVDVSGWIVSKFSVQPRSSRMASFELFE